MVCLVKRMYFSTARQRRVICLAASRTVAVLFMSQEVTEYFLFCTCHLALFARSGRNTEHMLAFLLYTALQIINWRGHDARLLAPFYAFVLHADEVADRYYKRLMRDKMHYPEEVYCKASQVCREGCEALIRPETYLGNHTTACRVVGGRKRLTRP